MKVLKAVTADEGEVRIVTCVFLDLKHECTWYILFYSQPYLGWSSHESKLTRVSPSLHTTSVYFLSSAGKKLCFNRFRLLEVVFSTYWF